MLSCTTAACLYRSVLGKAAAWSLDSVSVKTRLSGMSSLRDAPLLGQVVGPAEELQHGDDELLLGDGLVGPVVAIQLGIRLSRCTSEFGDRDAGRVPPGGGRYALGEEVIGEESARHVRSSEDG